jgi:hypothetical protein
MGVLPVLAVSLLLAFPLSAMAAPPAVQVDKPEKVTALDGYSSPAVDFQSRVLEPLNLRPVPVEEAVVPWPASFRTSSTTSWERRGS